MMVDSLAQMLHVETEKLLACLPLQRRKVRRRLAPLTAIIAMSVMQIKTLLGPQPPFRQSPALAPPEVQIDLAQQARYEAELRDAALQPLPDDDDADFES
ncbi:hypothetical protein GOP47_0029994 [Adiantum capillus-veneris]|nr:hypothetical protein GOP47_0029994 [Adiantum capillus-veneris]